MVFGVTNGYGTPPSPGTFAGFANATAGFDAFRDGQAGNLLGARPFSRAIRSASISPPLRAVL